MNSAARPLFIGPCFHKVKDGMIPDSVRRNILFPIACLMFLLSQFYRASVAVITPDLIRDLSMDSRGLSLISAAFITPLL